MYCETREEARRQFESMCPFDTLSMVRRDLGIKERKIKLFTESQVKILLDYVYFGKTEDGEGQNIPPRELKEGDEE